MSRKAVLVESKKNKLRFAALVLILLSIVGVVAAIGFTGKKQGPAPATVTAPR